MAESTPKSYHTDPQLYLYTSLTAGSSQIITATSRLETILKANKIPFKALDVATDEKARMLWGRRAGKRKLPGLVRMGTIVGDLEEVEEWNEYGELRENVDPSAPVKTFSATPTPSATNTPSKAPVAPPAPQDTPTKATGASTSSSAVSPSTPDSQSPNKSSNTTSTSTENPMTLAMRQAGFEAAKKAGDAKAKARTDALAAAKSKSEAAEDLKKLDHAGPTGLPPPTGTTEAEDAKAPETAGASVESRADGVPVTVEQKAEQAMSKSAVEATQDSGATDGGEKAVTKAPEATTDIPSTHDVEEPGNDSVLNDESEEVLEGTGQAEPELPPIQDIPSLASPPPAAEAPSAHDVEAAANTAIMKDRSHIVLVGHREAERTPPSGTPPNEPSEADREGENGTTGGEEAKTVEGADGKEMMPTPLKEVTATDQAQDLPGTKTQEQDAGDGEKAGESVAD
ncbi:hypothetical protein P7C71_g2262, partial [Lecanoromycetidae sp. Uapishka_2]